MTASLYLQRVRDCTRNCCRDPFCRRDWKRCYESVLSLTLRVTWWPLCPTEGIRRDILVSRVRIRSVAICVRARVQRSAQRTEQDCSCLPRDIIELTRTETTFDKSRNKTNRVRSSDDNRARHRTAVKADSISSSVMWSFCFHFQLWSVFHVQREGSVGALDHTSVRPKTF